MALFVYGGSFDPPHLSHVLALCLARAQAGAEFAGAVVIPTFQHPLHKRLAPFEHRIAMAEAAFGWIPDVRVSRLEQELGGESKTIRTLEALHQQHSDLRLLVGADILLEKDKWTAWDRIAELAPPYVLGRIGVTHEDSPAAQLPAISSTAVRAAVARGAWSEVAALVPAAVADYLRIHPLYEDS